MSQSLSTHSMPKIAYTIGDPAGIGMDIILQAAIENCLDDIVVIGNQNWLAHRAEILGIKIELISAEDEVSQKGQLAVEHFDSDAEHSALHTMAYLDLAINGCLDKTYSAMVTGPVNKAVINDAGMPFSGHTEYIAEKTGAELPVMMLATEGLRVALVTTHLPLKEVASAISPELVEQVSKIVWQDLRTKFSIENPTILMCGLNPHAGENGYLGMEEIEIINPTLKKLANDGIEIQGAYPADTLFQDKYLKDADAVISMYHDQGLPVLKFKGFGRSANITLGLPIVRTSVDHGTAYDLTGTGKADIGSLLTAIESARQMSGVA
jgi:4-hydroxythreonine-4-phosphate dehydrogenase